MKLTLHTIYLATHMNWDQDELKLILLQFCSPSSSTSVIRNSSSLHPSAISGIDPSFSRKPFLSSHNTTCHLSFRPHWQILSVTSDSQLLVHLILGSDQPLIPPTPIRIDYFILFSNIHLSHPSDDRSFILLFTKLIVINDFKTLTVILKVKGFIQTAIK